MGALLSKAEESVSYDKDKEKKEKREKEEKEEKDREIEDLKEKLSAAEKSIHTLNGEIDEGNDTMDGLQEEIDKLGKQLGEAHARHEAEMEAAKKQLEESLQGKDLELAERGKREALEILELRRVIEERSVEMEAVKGDLRRTSALLSKAEESVSYDKDKEKREKEEKKEKDREIEDLKEKLSAAEKSIHTLNSEIDEGNDTMDGLQ